MNGSRDGVKRAYRQADPDAARAREASAKRIRRAQPEGADARFKRDFLDVSFGHSCGVCDRLWFVYTHTQCFSRLYMAMSGRINGRIAGLPTIHSGASPTHHHSPRGYAVTFDYLSSSFL
ncbi:unnamed protein product [Ixodes hexagonus]